MFATVCNIELAVSWVLIAALRTDKYFVEKALEAFPLVEEVFVVAPFDAT